MNYELTEFSERELQLMSLALSQLMERNVSSNEKSILREMNVRALTALQIVRDREKVMNQ